MSDCKHDKLEIKRTVFNVPLIFCAAKDCPASFNLGDLDDYMIVRKPKDEEYNFDKMMGMEIASLDFLDIRKKGDENG